MEIEIYCDESNQQLLVKEDADGRPYFSIGGIWLPSEKRTEFKQGIKAIREKENCFGEIKWNKVSPSRLNFYLQLVDYFFQQDLDLRFRCILIDTTKLDLSTYHQADQELGYYKFCYQLIKNWIDDFNSYSIFVDCKTNRNYDRLRILHSYLSKSNLLADIKSIQSLSSNEVVFIQLADLLLGAVTAKLNNATVSEAKLMVIKQIEDNLKNPIMPTARGVRKFNIFKIALSEKR